jgi:hypothetical protein
MAPTSTDAGDQIARASALSNEEVTGELELAFRQKAAAEGKIVVLMGEVSRRESFRDEGATSAQAWTAERFGVSTPTARAYTHVAEKACDLPNLVGALCEGDITFDQLRAVADVATPETEIELRDQARRCSVRELADVARAQAQRSGSATRAEHDRRFVRFNEQCRTVSVGLPPESFAETRARLEARARELPSDGETPWDQRLCDAFMETIRSSAPGETGHGTTKGVSPHFVVVHVTLETLVDESSELPGELERDGFVSAETVRRLACDATVTIAIDDDVGHTMFEGRQRRWPSASQRREIMRRDRHCRFPGCANVTFTNVHHFSFP